MIKQMLDMFVKFTSFKICLVTDTNLYLTGILPEVLTFCLIYFNFLKEIFIDLERELLANLNKLLGISVNGKLL